MSLLPIFFSFNLLIITLLLTVVKIFVKDAIHCWLTHMVNLRYILITRSFSNSRDTCSLFLSPRIGKTQKRGGEKKKKKAKEKKNELESRFRVLRIQAVIERLLSPFPLSTSLPMGMGQNKAYIYPLIPSLVCSHFFSLFYLPSLYSSSYKYYPTLKNLMEFITSMFYLFSSIFFIFLLHSLIKFFTSSRPKLPLPPGTLGWPYIGETFQLYSQNPNVFFASKVKRFIPFCPFILKFAN